MAHDNRRADRVAEAIREEAATFLAEGAKDPRLVGFVTVTGVEVTSDLRHARIYVSVMGSDDERRVTQEGLDSLAGHLRSRLARRLRLRFTPEVRFHNDPTLARAARIELLLSQLSDGQEPADEESGN
jgi:ribosome-binding factor A